MKLKIVSATLLFASLTSAYAGDFTWDFQNHTNGYSNNELNAIIKRGIENAGNTPSLKKPWRLYVFVAGGAKNNAGVEPGVIMVEKVNNKSKEGVLVKCMKMYLGSFTKDGLASQLYEQIRSIPSYVTSNKECL